MNRRFCRGLVFLVVGGCWDWEDSLVCGFLYRGFGCA